MDDAALGLGERAVGRTQEGGTLADGRGDGVVGALEFIDDLRFAQAGELGVGEGVAADFVAGGDFALEDFGVELGVLTEDEESDVDALLFESVEEFGRGAGIGAVVEGQRDDRFGGGNVGEDIAVGGSRVANRSGAGLRAGGGFLLLGWSGGTGDAEEQKGQ